MITIAGMPGTFLDESVKHLRWLFAGVDAAGKAYKAQTHDGLLVAMISRDPVAGEDRPLWHLSVSFRRKDGAKTRYPTWDEIKHAKYQLVPEDVPMQLIFVRKKANYCDLHETTLHLWEMTGNWDEQEI